PAPWWSSAPRSPYGCCGSSRRGRLPGRAWSCGFHCRPSGRGSPDRPRSGSPPLPFVLVPAGQGGRHVIEQRVVPAPAHFPECGGPIGPGPLDRTDHQGTVLSPDLDLAVQPGLFEKQFWNPDPLRIPNPYDAGPHGSNLPCNYMVATPAVFG